MPDRERVIEKCQKCIDTGEAAQDYHFYYNVIALLEEQNTYDTREARIFQCEKCGYGFDDIFLIDERNYDIMPHYCPNCGRKVVENVSKADQ